MRYDEVGRLLTVVFRDGSVERYFDVPPSEWAACEVSFSKAAYLNSVLRLRGYRMESARWVRLAA